MSVTLMKTSTPRAGDEENHFPAHYSEADQMARFSSTGGCRYNNSSSRVTLFSDVYHDLAYPMPRSSYAKVASSWATSKVSPSFGSSCPHSLR